MNSSRIKRLDQILQNAPPPLKGITRSCIALVSETLITHELYNLTRDSLVTPVAHMLIDHLHDEGRHTIFSPTVSYDFGSNYPSYIKII